MITKQQKEILEKEVQRIDDEVDGSISFREFNKKSEFTIKEVADSFGSLEKASVELNVEFEEPTGLQER